MLLNFTIKLLSDNFNYTFSHTNMHTQTSDPSMHIQKRHLLHITNNLNVLAEQQSMQAIGEIIIVHMLLTKGWVSS